MDINKLIKMLITLSLKAKKKDEAPIAAIITYNGKIISKAYNRRNSSNYTIDHAEIRAISLANRKLHNWRLNKCTLYVTLEPCEMCKTVIKESRIDKVYYLVDRYSEKKQYNKTDFIKLNISLDNFEILQNYKSELSNFWKNKR